MDTGTPISPQVVLSEVRRILDERRGAHETIRTIRRLLEPPAVQRPVQLTDRGWPVMRSTDPCDDSSEGQ